MSTGSSDTFICGTCQTVFHDIGVFIQHKTEVTCIPAETQVPTSFLQLNQDSAAASPMTYFVIHDDSTGTNATAASSTNLYVNPGIKYVSSSSGFPLFNADSCEQGGGTSETTSTHSGIVVGNEVLEIIPVTSKDAEGPSVQHSLDLQLFVHPPQSTSSSGVGGNGSKATSQTGRKRGRPRKGEEKMPKNSIPSPVKLEEPIRPEKDAEGRYVCSRCQRAFMRDRHFKAHRCLPRIGYVNSMSREAFGDDVLDGEEAEQEQEDDCPKSPSFSRFEKKGMEPSKKRTRFIYDSNELLSTRSTSNDSPMGDEERPFSNLLPSAAIVKLETRKRSMPIFQDENDRLAFDRSLEVDLSPLVDHLFKLHVIDQEVNEHAPPARSRSQSTLNVFSCNWCRKVFMSLSHIRLHCLVHTDLKPFKCFKCDYATNTRGNLYTHMRSHTGMLYRCSICEFTSNNRGHLIEHEQTHSNVRHNCDLCHRDYNTVKSLINHIRKYHKNDEGAAYLARFQKKHTKSAAILHQCKVCNRKFKKRVDLDRHLLSHDLEQDSGVHTCDVCGHASSHDVHLEKHMRRHRVVYVCCTCGKKFPSVVRLQSHLRDVHRKTQDRSEMEKLFQDSIKISLFLPEPDGSMDRWLVSDQELEEFGEDLTRNVSSEILPTEEDLESVSVCANGSVDGNGSWSVGENCSMEVIENGSGNNPTCSDSVPNYALKEEEDAAAATEHYNFQSQTVSDEGANLAGFNLVPGDAGVLDSCSILNSSGYVPALPSIQPQHDETRTIGASISSEKFSFAEDSQDQTTAEVRDVVTPPPENPSSADEQQVNIFSKLGYFAMNLRIFENIRNTFGREECEFCGRLFASKSEARLHVRIHTGEKPFACCHCSYRAITKENLQSHIKKVHEKATFMCYICGWVGATCASLWLHNQKKHKTQPEFLCTKCNIMFDSVKRLRIHLQMKHVELDKIQIRDIISSFRRQHSRLGRRIHKCPYCEKTFPSSVLNLQKHMWIHEGVKPYKCALCTYSCRSQSNLAAHMVRHSSEKPYLCTDCGKPYKSRTALRWHVRSHKTGNTFACDRCPYKAVQPSHLKRHLETHDVIKRFPCRLCSYSANTVSYLKIHYTRNHEGQAVPTFDSLAPDDAARSLGTDNRHTLQCISCDFRFGNVSDMKRHLRTRHHIELDSSTSLENPVTDTEELRLDTGGAGELQLSAVEEIDHPSNGFQPPLTTTMNTSLEYLAGPVMAPVCEDETVRNRLEGGQQLIEEQIQLVRHQDVIQINQYAGESGGGGVGAGDALMNFGDEEIVILNQNGDQVFLAATSCGFVNLQDQFVVHYIDDQPGGGSVITDHPVDATQNWTTHAG